MLSMATLIISCLVTHNPRRINRQTQTERRFACRRKKGPSETATEPRGGNEDQRMKPRMPDNQRDPGGYKRQQRKKDVGPEVVVDAKTENVRRGDV